MTETRPLPWRRSLLWLLVLGPFFFLSYGYANQLAATRGVSSSLFFEWERNIPFIPWTIIPYWSIDLLYGFSFLCCRNERAVDRHALRLLTAQLISVACFLAFPLRFAFERPGTDGIPGALFTALSGFDQPYNQAPSLHISLLLIIWFQFSRLSVNFPTRILINAWAMLIGISVLTTWQHHFIDIPTGCAVGLLCLWLWPEGESASPLKRGRDAGELRMAGIYGIGAFVLAMAAAWIGGVGLLLAWPALSLGIVAWNYAWAGANGFQKITGRHSLAASWLLAPYMLGAWINSRWWTRHHPVPDRITSDVWLGRLPNDTEFSSGGFSALLDLTPELPAPTSAARYENHPCLDLVPADLDTLISAARQIDRLRQHGPVLVACALGYSRSAAAVATWLLLSGKVSSMAEAIANVRQNRPDIVLGGDWLHRLSAVEESLAQCS